MIQANDVSGASEAHSGKANFVWNSWLQEPSGRESWHKSVWNCGRKNSLTTCWRRDGYQLLNLIWFAVWSPEYFVRFKNAALRQYFVVFMLFFAPFLLVFLESCVTMVVFTFDRSQNRGWQCVRPAFHVQQRGVPWLYWYSSTWTRKQEVVPHQCKWRQFVWVLCSWYELICVHRFVLSVALSTIRWFPDDTTQCLLFLDHQFLLTWTMNARNVSSRSSMIRKRITRVRRWDLAWHWSARRPERSRTRPQK